MAGSALLRVRCALCARLALRMPRLALRTVCPSRPSPFTRTSSLTSYFLYHHLYYCCIIHTNNNNNNNIRVRVQRPESGFGALSLARHASSLVRSASGQVHTHIHTHTHIHIHTHTHTHIHIHIHMHIHIHIHIHIHTSRLRAGDDAPLSIQYLRCHTCNGCTIL